MSNNCSHPYCGMCYASLPSKDEVVALRAKVRSLEAALAAMRANTPAKQKPKKRKPNKDKRANKSSGYWPCPGCVNFEYDHDPERCSVLHFTL